MPFLPVSGLTLPLVLSLSALVLFGAVRVCAGTTVPSLRTVLRTWTLPWAKASAEKRLRLAMMMRVRFIMFPFGMELKANARARVARKIKTIKLNR